jgi:hypothetical protein
MTHPSKAKQSFSLTSPFEDHCVLLCIFMSLKTPFHTFEKLVFFILITYSKRHRSHFSWSFFMWPIHPWMASCDLPIHPFVSSFIHGWHHTWKKTLAEINNPPPFRMCCSLGKAWSALGGGTPKILISISHNAQRHTRTYACTHCVAW